VTVSESRPIVGIPASVRLLEFDLRFHGTGEQYLHAVRNIVGATAFTIPGLDDLQNAVELLDVMDGLLLTGSFSNLHPSTYGEEVTTDLGFYDQSRDAVTLPLIRVALERGMPVSSPGAARGARRRRSSTG
jgi:putative glutamine amidotransferase